MYFADTQRRWFIQTVGDQLLWGAAEPLRRMVRILLESGRMA